MVALLVQITSRISPQHRWRSAFSYSWDWTSSWLITPSSPTISAALASIALFSCSERTDPLSVTIPFREMILTF